MNFKDFWTRYFILREWFVLPIRRFPFPAWASPKPTALLVTFYLRKSFIDTTTFKMPQGGSNWSERFQDNLVYYFGNYVILTVATLFVLGVLSQQKPFVISLVFFFGLAASLLLVLEDTVNLGSFPVGLKEKCAAITLEWLLGAYITDSFAMWGYCLGLALVMVVVHASLKQRSALRGLSSIKDEAKFHVEKMGQDLQKLHEKSN